MFPSLLPQTGKVYESSSRNKAVAFGAISYYLDHFVTARLVKYTYGTIGHIPFDVFDLEHRQRSEEKQLSATGEFILEVFAPILLKVGSIQPAPRLDSSPRFSRAQGYLSRRSSPINLLGQALFLLV